MRKTAIAVAVVVLATAAVLFAAEKFVVEDGTSAKNPATCGGWWYAYDDTGSGGNSKLEPSQAEFAKVKDGGSYAAKLKGTTGNKLGWDFIGMGVTLSDKAGCPGGAVAVDISKYTTLSFKVKGELTGGRLIVNIPYSESKCDEGTHVTKSLTEWADYEAAISPKVSKSWTTVKLDLRKDFKQPKWAKKTVSIEEVLKNAHNINWHFSSPDGDSVEISVTDVELN
jgi:hypothetical protein